MNFANKYFCDEQLIRFLKEKDLKADDGANITISVTSYKKREQMIYFGKSDDGNEYEVRVYKAKPDNRYIHHALDNCTRVIENDEYATFLFKDFEDMKDFMDWIHYRHMEFRIRPMPKKD